MSDMPCFVSVLIYNAIWWCADTAVAVALIASMYANIGSNATIALHFLLLLLLLCTLQRGHTRSLLITQMVLQGQNARHLELGMDETVQRCFEECKIFAMTPQQCKIRIEQAVLSHPVNDLVVEIVPPKEVLAELDAERLEDLMPSIKEEHILKIPTDVHGYMACDHNAGIVKYPNQWIPAVPTLSGEPVSIVAQCTGMLASDCCLTLTKLAGRNAYGQCLHCAAVQQPLTPVPFTDGTSGFQDFSFDPNIMGGKCVPKTYTTPQIQNIDAAAHTLALQDESYVQKLKQVGSISCHDLTQLEARMLVHVRAIPAAQRYVGALTCQYCDPLTGEFIGEFLQLLASLAEALYFVETTKVNSAVAKVLIYTEEDMDPQTFQVVEEVMGTPQIDTSREHDVYEDCEEAPPLLLSEPPENSVLSPDAGTETSTGTSTGDLLPPPIGTTGEFAADITYNAGGEMTFTPDTGTNISTGTGDLPPAPMSMGEITTYTPYNAGGEMTFIADSAGITTTTYTCGIDTITTDGFPITHAGDVRQQCKSNLPYDLRLTTNNIVNLVNHEFYHDANDSNKCKTRLTYKICNYIYSQGMRRRLGEYVEQRARGVMPDHVRAALEREEAHQKMLQEQHESRPKNHMQHYVQEVLHRQDEERNLRNGGGGSGRLGLTGGGIRDGGAHGYGGLSSSSTTTASTSTSSNTESSPILPADEGVGASWSATNKGHVVLGWVGSCKVLDYGVLNSSDNTLDQTPFKLYNQVADPDTCMAGIRVEGVMVPASECVEVVVEYSGHVDISMPEPGITPPGSSLSYFGNCKTLDHVPIADCRNMPAMEWSTTTVRSMDGGGLAQVPPGSA
jgi:hypothetical protein